MPVMPLHFKCTIMLYVLALRDKQRSGNQEGGPNFTWVRSSLGKHPSLVRSLKVPVKKGRGKCYAEGVQGES